MDRKSVGIDYDPPAGISSSDPSSRSGERLFGALLLFAAVTVLGVVGYKVLFQNSSNASSDDSQALAQVDLRLTEIEKRLEHLETARAPVVAIQGNSGRKEKDEPVAPAPAGARTNPKTVYRVIYQEPPVVVPPPDERLNDIQKGLGVLQDEAKANRAALQATTDQLANVAGQVGVEHGEILKSQEQLNQLLARTERTPFSFELRRGSGRQLVGPLSLSLKTTSERKQRYTVCVYIQETCVELKDRSPYEVVQFSLSAGDALPYQVITTKIRNDGIQGYLEVPREKAGQATK